MKLRDFLNTMSVDCDALITIEGYCNQVEYDFKSERESNDRLSEIIEKNKTSLVLEEWYAEIMDKEVERFSSYYDEEQKRAVIEICVCEPNPVLKEEEENRIVDDFICEDCPSPTRRDITKTIIIETLPGNLPGR